MRFVSFVERMDAFSYAYLGGGFVSLKDSPQDIDLILETSMEYGPRSLEAMIPFFELGLTQIHRTYDVHLHFWAPGFPGEMKDFRTFFQYTHPKEQNRVPLQVKKGIVRVKLKTSRKIPLQSALNKECLVSALN